MNEQSTLITLQALRLFRGDDSARARAAFRQCTQKEMEQEYGQSGRTKAEILADYEQHEREVDEAIQWVHSLSEQLSKRTARLQVLRGNMTELQWRDFCYEHPHAITWFDNDNVPT